MVMVYSIGEWSVSSAKSESTCHESTKEMRGKEARVISIQLSW
jgi:hypothetical protein